MAEYLDRAGLKIDRVLAEFVEDAALPGLSIGAAAFWRGFADLVAEMTPRIRAALAERAEMQRRIDAWYAASEAVPGPEATEAFLREIGYLVEDGPDFRIETEGVDPEIAAQPGPQLVVPITNARYALNAANARWGSLYDALYGTDAMGDAPEGSGYDPARGARAIAWGRVHLDRVAPLAAGSWADIDAVAVADGALVPALADPAQFAGHRDAGDGRRAILLRVNGLGLEIRVDPDSAIGAQDKAGIADIRLEAAISAIMDCEDSVACVDGADKVAAYRNWLGLMRGDLTAEIEKDGRRFTRALAPDLEYLTPEGRPLTVKGRALMLVRNVGHLMTTPAVLDAAGAEIPEGLLDAMLTVAIAMHDLAKTQGARNSATGAIYVVKPKMHGPAEVALTDAIFDRVEAVLGLAPATVKIGIMDEERRTSVNLKECIRAAKRRVAFINTGFLDRTGDEIHTGMAAGPMIRKADMKAAPWIAAYEDRNVDIGLACGLKGRAQIGKGMWAMPDRMAEMLESKIAHPAAGATCAWVPSPTAAVLHATHYHHIDVLARQADLAAGGPRGRLADLLTLPVMGNKVPSAAEIRDEIENNAQGILGYVVRWVDQGIGCSKVPDIHDVGLMEDRATCRISSQALANWLRHGVVTEDQVQAALEKMARVVDRQNAGDPTYRPMAPEFDGPAFRAAAALIFEGAAQPSGYTEPLLHRYRQIAKTQTGA